MPIYEVGHSIIQIKQVKVLPIIIKHFIFKKSVWPTAVKKRSEGGQLQYIVLVKEKYWKQNIFLLILISPELGKPAKKRKAHTLAFGSTSDDPHPHYHHHLKSTVPE